MKQRIRIVADVNVCEWLDRLGPVGRVIDFSMGEEMNVVMLSKPDEQNAVYLRTPWNSKIYIRTDHFVYVEVGSVSGRVQ